MALAEGAGLPRSGVVHLPEQPLHFPHASDHGRSIFAHPSTSRPTASLIAPKAAPADVSGGFKNPSSPTPASKAPTPTPGPDKVNPTTQKSPDDYPKPTQAPDKAPSPDMGQKLPDDYPKPTQ